METANLSFLTGVLFPKLQYAFMITIRHGPLYLRAAPKCIEITAYDTYNRFEGTRWAPSAFRVPAFPQALAFIALQYRVAAKTRKFAPSGWWLQIRPITIVI